MNLYNDHRILTICDKNFIGQIKPIKLSTIYFKQPASPQNRFGLVV